MELTYNTERLSLKVLNNSYAEQSLKFYSEGKESFGKVEPPKPEGFYTLPYQSALLKNEYVSFHNGSYYRYYFTLHDDPDTIIGTASMSHIDRGIYRSCILGYKLLPEYQKQGYALEAMLKLLSVLLGDERFHRIEAFVLPDNRASINLLTRLGFEYEGIARSIIKLADGYKDHLRYVLINPRD